ncbi:MAG: ABC transporter permease subunit [Oscillospiraceae bacterium]|nr:ABC transporter permease subunit [Oscillospiraceae bacterium]
MFAFSYMAYPYMIIAFQRFNYRNHTIADILTKSEWVGLKNFNFFFASNNAYKVTYNTIYLNILFIFTGTLAAVLTAMLLNEMRSRLFTRVTQSIMLFPNYISWIVVCYILLALFSNRFGIINIAMERLGMAPINWYTEPKYWPSILVIVRILKGTGMSAVIYLAAIAGIDSSLYESARIDGASRLQLATRITLPLITPTIVILMLLSICKIMYGDFGMIYALVGDNGTLYETTDIIDTYIFRALRQVGDPSQAMAIGLFQSAIGFVMVFGSNRITQIVYPDGALY